jgi:hypothetical protein
MLSMSPLRTAIPLAATLVACTGGVTIPDGTGSGGSPGTSAATATTGTTTSAGVCVVGQDQTCNDSPTTSAIWGTCQAGGTCTCHPGFEVNPSTGLCRPVSDGGAPGCGDQTCKPDEFCVERVHSQDAGPVPATWQCQLYFMCMEHTCACALQNFVSASCISPTCESEDPVTLRCDDLN